MALGDSTATGARCDCVSYPRAYGDLIEEALGQPVRVRNEAINGSTSNDLFRLLDRSEPLRSAVGEADIITISTGINDINRCAGEGEHACYETAIAGLQGYLDALLGVIDTLQGSHPHVLRVTAYYNFMIGKPTANQDESFQAFYAEQLAALNTEICATAEAHGGVCIELLSAFNGPSGNEDAAELLVDDHIHPTSEGHQIIAAEIAAAGYAPLMP